MRNIKGSGASPPASASHHRDDLWLVSRQAKGGDIRKEKDGLLYKVCISISRLNWYLAASIGTEV
jgi:hypothetical protein